MVFWVHWIYSLVIAIADHCNLGPGMNTYYIIHNNNNNFIYLYTPKDSVVLLRYGLVILIYKKLCHIITLCSCYSGSDSD